MQTLAQLGEQRRYVLVPTGRSVLVDQRCSTAGMTGPTLYLSQRAAELSRQREPCVPQVVQMGIHPPDPFTGRLESVLQVQRPQLGAIPALEHVVG